jgi:hypothetical protein
MIKIDELEKITAECITDIQKRMKDTKTNASGNTSAGIYSEVSSYQIQIFSNRGGFSNVEAGQYPGKRPKNFREIMKQWIIDKGLTIKPMPYSSKYKGFKMFSSAQDRGLHYAAGAMAYTNAKKGSRLYRSGGRSDVFSPSVENLFNKVADLAANDLSLQIDAIFISTSI